jgi:hypothetical protein
MPVNAWIVKVCDKDNECRNEFCQSFYLNHVESCKNLSGSNDIISSVNTYGHCVHLYEHVNSEGQRKNTSNL